MTAAPAEPLGVGEIISSTFSNTFRRSLPTYVLAAVPSLLSALLGLMLFGTAIVPAEADSLSLGAVVLNIVVGVISVLVFGALVIATYLEMTGRTPNIVGSLGATLVVLIPMVIMTIAYSIIVGVGFLLLIVPGLWLIGVFAPFFQSILIERAGFGAFGRCAALTRGYRWPIIGAYVLMGLILILAQFLLAIPIVILTLTSVNFADPNSLGQAIDLGFLAWLIFTVIGTALSVVFTVFGVVFSNRIYMRLKEIKEGPDGRDLQQVFE